jgi:hypothetical protein
MPSRALPISVLNAVYKAAFLCTDGRAGIEAILRFGDYTAMRRVARVKTRMDSFRARVYSGDGSSLRRTAAVWPFSTVPGTCFGWRIVTRYPQKPTLGRKTGHHFHLMQYVHPILGRPMIQTRSVPSALRKVVPSPVPASPVVLFKKLSVCGPSGLGGLWKRRAAGKTIRIDASFTRSVTRIATDQSWAFRKPSTV